MHALTCGNSASNLASSDVCNRKDPMLKLPSTITYSHMRIEKRPRVAVFKCKLVGALDDGLCEMPGCVFRMLPKEAVLQNLSYVC